MPLNIKDETAHTLARDLSDITGETMTEAVRQALKERLERERGWRQGEASAAEIQEIGRRCAARLQGPAIDHATLLYGERGPTEMTLGASSVRAKAMGEPLLFKGDDFSRTDITAAR